VRYRVQHRLLVRVLLSCFLLAGARVAQAQQVGTRCGRLTSSKSQSGRTKARESSATGTARAAAANRSINSAANSAPAANSSSAQAAVSAGPLAGARATQSLIDASIPDDAALDTMLGPYRVKVRELDTVIGSLEGTLIKGRVVGGSMGNFVTDAVREQAQRQLGKPLALAILNRDGLRKNTIAQGSLRARDIFEILPFENELLAVDLTGAQLRHLLETLMSNLDLAQSGARIKYQTNEKGRYEIVSLKLIGPTGALEEIDPARTYTIVTVDFIMTRGGAYDFLKEIKTVSPLNLKIRDAVTAYVKAMTAAGLVIKATEDGRIEGPGMLEGEIT
jgi:2',3'-cyclic-nucleotide 2'-phosphodiesterase (5'-nucleotidase family)